MKTIFLLVLLLYLLPPGHDPLCQLIGKWKLKKVETNGKTLVPTKKAYFLHITKSMISYNSLNMPVEGHKDCWTDNFSVDSTSITLKEITCTPEAKDAPFDPVTNYINYSGTYKLHDSTLEISNDKGKLYLIKQVYIGDFYDNGAELQDK